MATLNAAVRSAALLGCDPDMIARWTALERDLRTGLPHDGQKYVPFPGCEQKSSDERRGVSRSEGRGHGREA